LSQQGQKLYIIKNYILFLGLSIDHSMSEVDRFWQRLWEKSHASFLPMIALEGPFGLGLIYKTQSGINVAVNDLRY
jgi:hypothetical protein